MTLASASAVAQTHGDVPPANRVARVNLSGTALMGVWNGGFILGGTALARIGHFDVGAEGVSGTDVWDYKYTGWAADAGLGWQIARGWRLDALGAVGVHHYSGVGSGNAGPDDPGASATLGFVGVRFLAGYVFGKGPSHFELGVLGFYEDDLARSTMSSYDSGQDGVATDVVGTSRYGAALTLSFSYDSW